MQPFDRVAASVGMMEPAQILRWARFRRPMLIRSAPSRHCATRSGKPLRSCIAPPGILRDSSGVPLSDEQLDFIDAAINGPTRLLAGPGTGKSFTAVALLERLATLDPKPRCHMITFTRAATKELQGKLA